MDKPIPLINLGGFVPLSTVDWRGRAVCTVFFRGCPCKCPACHNQSLQKMSPAYNTPVKDVLKKIKESAPYVTGVVFSGGEPCMQPDALQVLLRKTRELDLLTCLHTSGVCHENLFETLMFGLVDHVCLDLKTSFNQYDEWTGLIGSGNAVRNSLVILKECQNLGKIRSYELVTTCFQHEQVLNTDRISSIAENVPDNTKYVLQQGNYGNQQTITFMQLENLAKGLHRTNTFIRTRQSGEVKVA